MLEVKYRYRASKNPYISANQGLINLFCKWPDGRLF
jgi:hypothetical protein